MTTIVYKNGIIAYDSLSTAGDHVCDYNTEKHFVINNVHFFISGTISNFEEFTANYFKYKNKKVINTPFVSGGAFVIDNKALYLFGLDQECDEYFITPINLEKQCAIGSGSEYAYGAMSVGAEAYEAAEAACYWDLYSGGEIKTWEVGNIDNNFITKYSYEKLK